MPSPGCDSTADYAVLVGYQGSHQQKHENKISSYTTIHKKHHSQNGKRCFRGQAPEPPRLFGGKPPNPQKCIGRGRSAPAFSFWCWTLRGYAPEPPLFRLARRPPAAHRTIFGDQLRYIYMKLLAIIIIIVLGAILNALTRHHGHP